MASEREDQDQEPVKVVRDVSPVDIGRTLFALNREVSLRNYKLDSGKDYHGDISLPRIHTNDVDLVQLTLAFTRIMLESLVGQVGGFRSQLPAACPIELTRTLEQCAQNAMELLCFASRIPEALDDVNLDEFMSFIVMLMGSRQHITSRRMRTKMVEVLISWTPSKCNSLTLGRSMTSLFEGHHLALQYLVPNLLQLHADIEFKSRDCIEEAHTQFHNLSSTRREIVELLGYLWGVPGHHSCWKQIAVKEERGLYLKFLNILINDSIFLLDASLKILPKLEEMQVQLADTTGRPAQERLQIEEFYRQEEYVAQIDLALAIENVKMIQNTSGEISAPFFLPEMVERITAMLNYFLLQLIGAQRKALKVKDPEKYEVWLKELLVQIINIYVHLDKHNPQGSFVRAISTDRRSYRKELVTEAASIVRRHEGGSSVKLAEEFEAVGAKASAHAQKMMDVAESYCYKALDTTQNEIRVVKLDAVSSEPQRPLSGRILHIPLEKRDARFQYWALSYCWGNPDLRRTIILDGKQLQITADLDNALRELGSSYDTLWVDAICINQGDVQEKSREVLRMGEIYSQAEGVVAWLGVADNTSDAAADFLKLLANQEPRPLYDEVVIELKQFSSAALGKHSSLWASLKDLVLRPYWSRTWIIQELATCRGKKIVRCGKASMLWDDFAKVFHPNFNTGGLTHEDIALACGSVISREEEYFNEYILSQNCLRVIGIFQVPDVRRTISFPYLSFVTSTFLATNPRDRIYGMLGLSEELHRLVPHPDYSKPMDEVFGDLTKALLKSGYSLALICLKRPLYANQPNVISWAPDWAGHGHWTQSPAWLIKAVMEERGAFSFATTESDDKANRVLRVRGFFIDRVDGLGSVPNFEMVRKFARVLTLATEKDAACQPKQSLNAYGSDVETFKALKQLSQGIFRSGSGLPRGRLFWDSSLTVEGDSNTYSMYCEHLIARLHRQKPFLDGWSYRQVRDVLEETEKFCFQGRSLREWFEFAYLDDHKLSSADPKQYSDIAGPSSSSDPELDTMVQIINGLEKYGWRWFTTDHGFLGQIHSQAQPGDEIAIVSGCTVPVVLRKSLHQQYTVVGAAYVQGLMSGQAFHEVADDKMEDIYLV